MKNKLAGQAVKTTAGALLGTKRLIVVLCIGFAALAAAGGVFLTVYFKQQAPASVKPGQPDFAPNAQIGILPGKTKEQIEELLNQKIDENTIAFSINSNIIMKNGNSQANLMLESPSNNIHYVEFVVKRDDNGQVLYRSGLLKPNQYILNDKLQASPSLSKGSYPCTADITLYDKDTMNARGMVQAGVVVSVMN